MSRTASDADRIELEADEGGMADVAFVEFHRFSEVRGVPISPVQSIPIRRESLNWTPEKTQKGNCVKLRSQLSNSHCTNLQFWKLVSAKELLANRHS